MTLALILLIAFVVRVSSLEAPSIWVDEATSLHRAAMGPSEMITTLAFDHVPLYYLMLQAWVRLVGTSVFSLRMPTVLFGVLVVSQVYVLAKHLFDKAAGRIAALLTAVSPFLVFYSRMARPYPLLWSCILWAVIMYVTALRTGRWRWWLLYAVAATTAVYSHFTAVPVLIFLGLYPLLYWRRLKAQWPQWIAAHTVLALAFLPLITKALDLAITIQSTIVGRGTLTLWYLADLFVRWNVGYALQTRKLVFVILLATFGLLTGIGLFSLRLSPDSQGASHSRSGRLSLIGRAHFGSRELLLLGSLIAPVGLGVVAKLMRPDTFSFEARTLSVASLPYYLLLARGVQMLGPTVLRRVVLPGCIAVMLVATAASLGKGGGIDWRHVAATIDRQGRTDDLVLVVPAGQYLSALKTYYSGPASLRDTAADRVNSANVASILSPAVGYDRVWLITINGAQYDPGDLLDGWMTSRCVPREQMELIPRHAWMRLYEHCVVRMQ